MFQADFARDRSCDVNTAREVFRLPSVVLEPNHMAEGMDGVEGNVLCDMEKTSFGKEWFAKENFQNIFKFAQNIRIEVLF